MTTSISTQALTGAIEDPTCVVVDVREMAAFNGWICHHEARGGIFVEPSLFHWSGQL